MEMSQGSSLYSHLKQTKKLFFCFYKAEEPGLVYFMINLKLLLEDKD
jgi:hypothetical protein